MSSIRRPSLCHTWLQAKQSSPCTHLHHTPPPAPPGGEGEKISIALHFFRPPQCPFSLPPLSLASRAENFVTDPLFPRHTTPSLPHPPFAKLCLCRGALASPSLPFPFEPKNKCEAHLIAEFMGTRWRKEVKIHTLQFCSFLCCTGSRFLLASYLTVLTLQNDSMRLLSLKRQESSVPSPRLPPIPPGNLKAPEFKVHSLFGFGLLVVFRLESPVRREWFKYEDLGFRV